LFIRGIGVTERVKILLVAGARPNFVKIAPLMRALAARSNHFDTKLVHTGQHYDTSMSESFFEELGIPQPDFRLEVGSYSHAQQTARIMMAFETVCFAEKPRLVVVVGDVNSTVACSLVAKKLQIDVAHVEAGLRSGDRRMPEEINRIVTDSISDWFFVTEPSGVDNLRREGHEATRIHLAGNVMIDNLFYQQRRLENFPPNEQAEILRTELGHRYGVVTLHRPSNVDDEATIRSILSGIGKVAERVPLVFAVHPRTSAMLEHCGIEVPPRVYLSPPLPYMAFLSLWSRSALVITDSGGLQEETTALGIPCITVRENTERPITLTEGTNVMVGRDPARIVKEAFRVLDGHGKVGRRPALWEGCAAERIVGILEDAYIHRQRTVA
jgi:UDP-N-acetylglucosamine 2-epimerase (non-hydrolysing)